MKKSKFNPDYSSAILVRTICNGNSLELKFDSYDEWKSYRSEFESVFGKSYFTDVCVFKLTYSKLSE